MITAQVNPAALQQVCENTFAHIVLRLHSQHGLYPPRSHHEENACGHHGGNDAESPAQSGRGAVARGNVDGQLRGPYKAQVGSDDAAAHQRVERGLKAVLFQVAQQETEYVGDGTCHEELLGMV